MSMFRTRHFTGWLAAAWLALAVNSTADSTPPEQQFREIQRVLEANCAECHGASKDQFIQAVRALELLVASGFADTSARMLLARSYRVWAFTYTENSEESEALLRKERAIYLDLIQSAPEDPDIWIAYAQALEDPAETLRALKRAESLSPDDAFTQFSLGMLYAYGLHDREMGIQHLEHAVQLERGLAKLTYGEQLAQVLEQKSRRDEAAQVRDTMKQFLQELEARDREKKESK